jgi:hypothetical protein
MIERNKKVSLFTSLKLKIESVLSQTTLAYFKTNTLSSEKVIDAALALKPRVQVEHLPE